MAISKTTIWKFQSVNDDAAQALAKALCLPLSVACVLVQRGFSTPELVGSFLSPRLNDLDDPFLLPDMERAVARVWKAIDRQERITIFGDYDVDGVTSAALMLRVLSSLGALVDSFVPDRLEEGYGLSVDAMERCLEEYSCNLIITVDCGTNSEESIAGARQRGVDVIVTDHHEPSGAAPSAYALVNPKLGTVGENLAGVGVAFKFLHALLKRGDENAEQIHFARKVLRSGLDLVALGTVADIVPLVGENRTLVRHGLAQMKSSCWVGMEALKEVAAIKGELVPVHLGFQLGPRINAAGRIGEPAKAVRLLTTNDPLEARNIAKLLDRNNQERRDIERKMADEAFAEIDRYYDPKDRFGLVVARDGWHPGVVGIVASRVARHYNRPTIILGVDEDGRGRGSCRGIDAFDLLEGLKACEEHLETFGGHKMAAGVTVRSGHLARFSEAFNTFATLHLAAEDLSPVVQIDAVVEPEEMEWAFYDVLGRLQPFGQDNPEPTWAFLDVCVEGVPKVVGQNHLKFIVKTAAGSFDAIAFNFPVESLPEGRIDVAFSLKENRWQGNRSLQLQVQDVCSAAGKK